MKIEKRLKIRSEKDLIKKQESGLQEIFKFYSSQGVSLNQSITFEEMQSEHQYLQMKYYLKFCVDFVMPGTKRDWVEVYRRKVKRETVFLDYETFKDCLMEVFKFSLEQKLLEKEKELDFANEQIKIINEENQKRHQLEHTNDHTHY